MRIDSKDLYGSDLHNFALVSTKKYSEFDKDFSYRGITGYKLCSVCTSFPNATAKAYSILKQVIEKDYTLKPVVNMKQELLVNKVGYVVEDAGVTFYIVEV